MNISKLQLSRYILDILLLLLAICFTLSFSLWTNHEDLYYWYVLCDFFAEEPLVCLSLWMAKIWKGIVGGNSFLFNFLGVVIGVVPLIVPYIVLQDREQRVNNLIFLAIGIVMAGPIAVGVYTPDVPTNILIVILSVILLKYKICNTRMLLVASTISAMAIASRFPNVLLLPVCSLYIAYQLRKHETGKKYIGYTVSYVVTTIIMYLLIMIVLSHELNVFAFIASAFVNPISGSDTSHTLGELLANYLKSGLYYLKSLLPIVLCFIAYCRFNKRPLLKYILLVVSPLIYLCSIYYFLNEKNNFCFCFIHGSFVVIALLLYNMYVLRNKHFSIPVLFVIALGFITCAGSNTGFLKIGPYFAAYLPLVLISLHSNRKLDKFIVANLSVLIFMSVMSLFMRKIPHRSINPWGVLFERITDYKYRIPESSYYGFMEKVDYEITKGGLEYYKRYGNPDHTYFYGNNYALRLYALSGTRVPYRLPYYFAPDDEIAINILLNAMAEDTNPVLFDFTKSKVISRRLLKQNYSVIHEDDVDVYIKRSLGKWKR